MLVLSLLLEPIKEKDGGHRKANSAEIHQCTQKFTLLRGNVDESCHIKALKDDMTPAL